MNRSPMLATSLIALSLALTACGGPEPETPTPTETAEMDDAAALPEITVAPEDLAGNPFLADWETPFGVPPFDQIEASHYMPAMQRAILDLRQEIEAITNSADAPTFENTILPLETSGALVTKVVLTFSGVAATELDDDLRALQTEIWPMLTRETDAISLNPVLFDRVKTVYDARETLGLGEQEARLVELTYRDFVRSGANLEPETKAAVADINARLSELTTLFGQNLLASTKAFQLEITDEAMLEGLSPDFRAAIRADADTDLWTVTLDRSVFETFMTQST
ncbi:MAG: M3 family peptidase, partial [Pseudomonadota bacterium]